MEKKYKTYRYIRGNIIGLLAALPANGKKKKYMFLTADGFTIYNQIWNLNKATTDANMFLSERGWVYAGEVEFKKWPLYEELDEKLWILNGTVELHDFEHVTKIVVPLTQKGYVDVVALAKILELEDGQSAYNAVFKRYGKAAADALHIMLSKRIKNL